MKLSGSTVATMLKSAPACPRPLAAAPMSAVLLLALACASSDGETDHAETPPARLTGRVCFGDDGVAKALLRVGSKPPGRELQPGISHDTDLVDMLTASSTKPRWQVTTTTSGEFDVQVLASGDLCLYVEMPGGGQVLPVPVKLVPGETFEAEVHADGPYIAGQVVEHGSGRVLVDATLQLSSVPGLDWMSELTSLPGTIPARTDAEGHFFLACVPPTIPGILVEHPGHVSRRIGPFAMEKGSLHEMRVELDPEAVVEGDIRDSSGGLLAGEQTVVLQREDRRTFPSGEHTLSGDVKDGHFRIGGVPACRCIVRVFDNLGSGWIRIQQAEDERTPVSCVIETEAGKTRALPLTLLPKN